CSYAPRANVRRGRPRSRAGQDTRALFRACSAQPGRGRKSTGCLPSFGSEHPWQLPLPPLVVLQAFEWTAWLLSAVLADRGRAPLVLPAAFARGFTLSLCSLYSTESTSACQLASTTLLDKPTVPHRRLPSVDSIKTRTRASVPAPLSSTRTL